MKRQRALAFALTACLLTTSLAAQAKPDFSGRWTSAPDPAAGAQRGAAPPRGGGQPGGGRGDIGSGWGPTITIAQDNARLSVEFAFFTRGDMQPPTKFVYALDGSESKNSVMMGRGIQVQTSKTKWDGDNLVITTSYTFTDPETGKPASSDVTRTLSLENGSLVVTTATSGVPGGPGSTARTVYRKTQ